MTERGVLTAAVDDIRSVPILERLQTVAMTTGVLAFGVALGVKWAAVGTFNRIPLVNEMGFTRPIVLELSSLYNSRIEMALWVAAVALIAAVVVDFRGGRSD